MHLHLSDRLRACCNFVPRGCRVADVGCDHGYLSIHLLREGIASSVIASDINEQPLNSAIRNAEKYGVQDHIRFYLSDGIRSVPRDFDCMICAGMGADTMISILSAAPWLKDEKYTLVLQCQSKTHTLRRYLSDNGFRIYEETVLRDGKFLYTVMQVGYRPEHPRLTAGECHFPPALLENPSAELPSYYRWVTEGLRISAVHRDDPALHTALKELQLLAENLPFLLEDNL